MMMMMMMSVRFVECDNIVVRSIVRPVGPVGSTWLGSNIHDRSSPGSNQNFD